MTVSFILNGADVMVQADPDERLVSVLRDDFFLAGSKEGCMSGKCGSCAVLFNGRCVPACLIPMYRAHNCEIITIEGFMQTDDYGDIARGFKNAGVSLCGYCDAGKILIAADLLEAEAFPSEENVRLAYAGSLCHCADTGDLIAGIRFAAEIRQRRLHAR